MASTPTLRALLIDRLKELYGAEHGVIKVLPRIARVTANSQLKKAFNQSLLQTRRQVIRLAQSQRTLGLPPTGKACRAMPGLIQDATDMIGLESPPAVHDAALIGAVQRIQLYRMAGYHTAGHLAAACGESGIAEQLKETWREEKDANAQLARLAASVNADALASEEALASPSSAPQ